MSEGYDDEDIMRRDWERDIYKRCDAEDAAAVDKQMSKEHAASKRKTAGELTKQLAHEIAEHFNNACECSAKEFNQEAYLEQIDLELYARTRTAMSKEHVPPAAAKCGEPAASFIPRLGMSFACVLPKGHEGEHKPGGNCYKHGEYVGANCPKHPDCLPAASSEGERCPTETLSSQCQR